MTKQRSMKLSVASTGTITIKEPILFVVGTGKSAYVWIGNNTKGDSWCYAVTNRNRLRKFLNKKD